MKLVTFFQNFKKAVDVLSVNEAKVPLKNVFIDHLLVIKSETKSKNHKSMLRPAGNF